MAALATGRDLRRPGHRLPGPARRPGRFRQAGAGRGQRRGGGTGLHRCSATWTWSSWTRGPGCGPRSPSWGFRPRRPAVGCCPSGWAGSRPPPCSWRRSGSTPTRPWPADWPSAACPAGTVVEETLTLARRIAAFPPHATRQIKRLMMDGRRGPVVAARAAGGGGLCRPVRRPVDQSGITADRRPGRLSPVHLGHHRLPHRSGHGPGRLARAVEERGFFSLYLPEHTHLPVRADAPRPWSKGSTSRTTGAVSTRWWPWPPPPP